MRFGAVVPWRLERLERAAARFAEHASSADRDALAAFCRAESDWLEDYALFMALADHAPGRSWCDWDQALARRDPAALQAATSTHAARIDAHKFWQWRFAEQWRALRAHAHARGVRMALDRVEPKDLVDAQNDRIPVINREQEDALRGQFESLSGLPHNDARKALAELCGQHARRASGVWAELGEAPLACAALPASSKARTA